jgi:RimJ/RimL family protein N-acetyltransferase
MFPTTYKCLTKNEYYDGDFKIVPIRYEDRLDIMKWRNEQMYHLRQDKPLTEIAQENYFRGTVSDLFDKEKPNQILFSFLKDDQLIGYGGLVHINWLDKNAEISFLMNTELEKLSFSFLWKKYLGLIEKVSFNDLKLKKMYTYAFDLRPRIYKIFENSGFIKEAELKDHCYFNYEFKSVIVHSKFNKNLNIK